MQTKKISTLLKWWVTPKLPPEDIFAKHNFITQWLIHPIKRRLARIYLRFLKKNFNVKVIGITGSTGKTTTTELLASILKLKGNTIWSAEGVDPVYNIPNTILKARPSTKYIVLEMSVEYKNEMDFYLWLAKPDIGIITNISATHTEFLGNPEGVANEKGKLIANLDVSGVAILNGDEKVVSNLSQFAKARVVYFGQNKQISASNIKYNPDMSTNFTLKVNKSTKIIHVRALGNQIVSNILAAAAAASALGVEIKVIGEGVSNFDLPKHRMNIIKSKKYGLIFDDTYNSNPKAAEESINTFKILSSGKKTVGVIGDMLELGSVEEESHRKLGVSAGNSGFTYLIGVGKASRFVIEEAAKQIGDGHCFLVNDYKEALDIVMPKLGSKTALFVKGSRSIHLDKLVEELS